MEFNLSADLVRVWWCKIQWQWGTRVQLALATMIHPAVMVYHAKIDNA